MPRYTIAYSRTATADLRSLDRRAAAEVTDSVVRHLADEPVPVPGREGQRRAMNPNPLNAAYRLRIGDYRAYYDVNEENAVVEIIRVGYKPGETVYFQGRPSQMRD